ncbi:chitin synthase-domain-containing protein [Lactarius hengduanensis]|nr:chitin synthase-domain-containing protein [Lactarius hengduanensis]
MPGQQPQHNAPPDADANNNIRYGRIPQRVPRRNKTLKRVDLFQGNTVFSFFAMPYQAKSLRPLPCAVFAPSYPFTTVAAAITTTTACRLRATPYEDEGDDDTNNKIRYGRTPQRVPRRNKTSKRVELFHSNFVLDYAVPTKLLDLCACTMTHHAGRRFFHDDVQQGRCLFARTMHGVMKNITYSVQAGSQQDLGQGQLGGRQDLRALSAIPAIGAYQEGIATNVVNSKLILISAHIYKHTTSTPLRLIPRETVAIMESNKIKGAGKGIVPVQIVVCLKEKNQTKINSHRWFFDAFGPVLQLNVCFVPDVGTRSGPSSIYHLWKAFNISSNIGGACGEIVAFKGKYRQTQLNPPGSSFLSPHSSMTRSFPCTTGRAKFRIQDVQHPGQAIARLAPVYCIAERRPWRGSLQKYFLGETLARRSNLFHFAPNNPHRAGPDIFAANMYLAEDRISCWVLVSNSLSAAGRRWGMQLDRQLSSIAQMCDHFSPFISRVEDLGINADKPLSGPCDAEWLKVVHSSGGKMDSYYVDGKLVTDILCALGLTDGEHPIWHAYRIVCPYCGDFKFTPRCSDLFREHLASKHPEVPHTGTPTANPALQSSPSYAGSHGTQQNDLHASVIFECFTEFKVTLIIDGS